MLDDFACIKVKKDVCIKILYYNQLLFHTLVWIQWNRYRCRLALNRNSCVIRSRLLLFRSCALYCLSYEQLSSHLPLRYSHCCFVRFRRCDVFYVCKFLKFTFGFVWELWWWDTYFFGFICTKWSFFGFFNPFK